MYKEHPVFKKPKNENATVWRYMDFTKLVSLLDKSALFFCRVDRLDDPLEGSYSKANILLRPVAYSLTESDLEGLGELHKRARELFAVNCWHLSEHESEAMWKIYLKSGYGIAIRSTFNRLRDCFNNTTTDVYIGTVKYINYASSKLKDSMGWGNVLISILHKNQSFEYERELRAVVQVHSENSQVLFSKGLFISVDLNMLIDRIYLAPRSPKWLYELVKSVTRKYGLKKIPVQSALDARPLY